MSRWPGNPKREHTTFGGLSRGALMSRIRSSGNLTTEIKFLSMLRQSRITGWRRNYPLKGKPDFTFPKKKLVVFIDGCFWHGHNCGRKLKPKTNARVWKIKIETTQKRDRRISIELRKNGWHVVRLWECQLSKRPDASMRRIVKFL